MVLSGVFMRLALVVVLLSESGGGERKCFLLPKP